MAFDRELAISYGFFNLRIYKKTAFLEKCSSGAQNIFFFFFFKFYIKMQIILYKIVKFYVLNQSRSILLVPPKYTLEN